MTRARLQLLFGAILVTMLLVTIRASLDRSIFDAGEVIRDPWGLATLVDAYCGFLTFFAWVAYRESTNAARLGWFVAIMTLGNIAMSGYLLLVLRRLPKTAGAKDVLLRDPVARPSL